MMHQICDWAKYHEFTFYVVIFVPMKIPTLSAPQNDCLNLLFVKDKNIQAAAYNDARTVFLSQGSDSHF